MKKQLTEKQIEARDERRLRFRALVKQVAEMPDEQRAQLTNRLGAVPTCEGRLLSLCNTCLLMLQQPDVSMVGGFRQWKKLGRSVRKGEHGAMIWIPLGAPKENGESIQQAAAEVEAGEKKRFLIGTVFDVSQTDPAEAKEELQQKIENAERAAGWDATP